MLVLLSMLPEIENSTLYFVIAFPRFPRFQIRKKLSTSFDIFYRDQLYYSTIGCIVAYVGRDARARMAMQFKRNDRLAICL